MTTMHAPRIALDESAITFVATFMKHVAALTKHDRTRIATTASIETLLLAAIERGEGASSSEWQALYRAIVDLVETSVYAYDARVAYTYFRTFIRENADLARESRPRF